MNVARIHRTRAEKIARMIEHHQNHDQATQQINAVEPWSSRLAARQSAVRNAG